MGIQCEVVNARFVKPLDEEALLQDAKKTNLIVSVEEGAVAGGLGSAILETLAANGLNTPVLNLGIPDEFIEHGAVKRLHAYCEIDVNSIVKLVAEKASKNKARVEIKILDTPARPTPHPLHH